MTKGFLKFLSLGLLAYISIGCSQKQSASFISSGTKHHDSEWFKLEIKGTDGRTAWVHQENLALAQNYDGETLLVIDLVQQRLDAFWDGKRVISTPVSTGKVGHETPRGRFEILEKQRMNRSSLYGDVVSEDGVRLTGSVDRRDITIPEDAEWRGAKLPHWMRLTWSGIGLHTGEIGDTPLSHGCIRLPELVSEQLYAFTKVGSAVVVK